VCSYNKLWSEKEEYGVPVSHVSIKHHHDKMQDVKRKVWKCAHDMIMLSRGEFINYCRPPRNVVCGGKISLLLHHLEPFAVKSLTSWPHIYHIADTHRDWMPLFSDLFHESFSELNFFSSHFFHPENDGSHLEVWVDNYGGIKGGLSP
jgi:hypothetical protein